MSRRMSVLPVALLLTTVVEVIVFVAVVRWVGAGWTVLAAVVVSMIGMLLLRREGMRAWRHWQGAVRRGEAPGVRVSDGLVGLFGGALLAVPGFVTAVAGLLLVLPPLRGFARRRVERIAERRVGSAAAGDLFGPRRVRVRRGAPVAEPPVAEATRTPEQAGPAIEGEIVDARP